MAATDLFTKPDPIPLTRRSLEVGRVWRQIPKPGACGADHLPDGGRLVGAKIDGVDAPWRHRCAKVVSLIIT